MLYNYYTLGLRFAFKNQVLDYWICLRLLRGDNLLLLQVTEGNYRL